MIPALAALLSALAANGLSLIGNAVLSKGKEVVEEKLGVNLDEMMGSEAGRIRLAEIQAERESDLNAFILEKREQELTADRMVNEDRDSARDMQKAALGQTDIFAKRFVYYFAIYWSIVSSVYVAFITFGTIPPSNIRFADTILGFLLGTLVATLVQFFYGSSNSSKAKDDTVIEAVRGMSK